MSLVNNAGASGTLTFNALNDGLTPVMQSTETQLTSQLRSMGENASTSDLLAVQQKLQQWSMLTQVQSTVVKELADALKGIIQKSG